MVHRDRAPAWLSATQVRQQLHVRVLPGVDALTEAQVGELPPVLDGFQVTGDHLVTRFGELPAQPLRLQLVTRRAERNVPERVGRGGQPGCLPLPGDEVEHQLVAVPVDEPAPVLHSRPARQGQQQVVEGQAGRGGDLVTAGPAGQGVHRDRAPRCLGLLDQRGLVGQRGQPVCTELARGQGHQPVAVLDQRQHMAL